MLSSFVMQTTLMSSVSLSIVLCLAQDMGHGNRWREGYRMIPNVSLSPPSPLRLDFGCYFLSAGQSSMNLIPWHIVIQPTGL